MILTIDPFKNVATGLYDYIRYDTKNLRKVGK